MSAAVIDKDGELAPDLSATGRRVLGNLPTRARTTGAQALARSRMVRRLRLALPILALVLFAVFILNTQSNGVDDAFLEDFEDLTASTEELRMANPRFAGVDDKGQPFEITARSAKQNPGRRDVVELEQPRAVQGDADEISVVTADSGVYQSEANILELTDSVTLEHTIGKDTYVLRSPSAIVSIKDKVVTSGAGVGGKSSDGNALKADRMKAYNAEGRVVFEGNVSMRIYPKLEKDNDDGDNGAPALKDVEINEPK